MAFSEKIKKWLSKYRYLSRPEDRTILLTCMGFALIFWLLVKLSQEFSASKPVELVLNIPEGKALSALPPGDIKAQLHGSGWDLAFEFLKRSRLLVPIDLTNSAHFYLSEAQLRTLIGDRLNSSDLKVESVNVNGLSFDLQDKVQKKVPLLLQARIGFAAGHQQFGPIALSPDSVTVTGPAEAIANITRWTTDSVIVNDLSATLNREVRITPPPDVIRADPAKIAVTVEVEDLTEKTVYVPVRIVNSSADSLKVFPDMVQVSFVVGLSRFEDITHEDFDLVADLKDFRYKEGKNTAPLTLTRQPADIKNVNLNKRSVEFLIVK